MGCSITEKQFKTRTKTYIIKNIEKSSIHYSLLFMLPIAILIVAFTYRFENYLYDYEIKWSYILSLILFVLSVSMGSLKIYTRVIEDKAVFGFIPSIKKIRNTLDEAIEKSHDGNDTLNRSGNYDE